MVKNFVLKFKNYVKRKHPKCFKAMKRAYHKLKGLNKEYRILIKERYIRSLHTQEEEMSFLSDLSKKVKVFEGKTKSYSLLHLLSNVDIKVNDNDYFFYSIDVFKTWYCQDRLMVNSTLDYSRILDNSVSSLYMRDGSDGFVKENNRSVDAILKYIDRSVSYLRKNKVKNATKIENNLLQMKSEKCQSFEEGLQRILFINQILWQTEHRLVGLGRLDKTLHNLYYSDLNSGALTKDEAKKLIKEFLLSLHKYYWFKSDALMGDTGQIIILGGNEPNGTYFYNDLTYLFIDAVKELQNPDPKVLLRVGRNIPNDLMETALNCIQTGIGCPLLSNDEEVIPRMINFGYEEKDAYQYVTSACWEPLVPAVAHEQNNIGLINFLLPFDLLSEKEGYSQFDSFDKLMEGYFRHLDGHIWFVGTLLDSIVWEKDPLVSMFTEPCRRGHKDISEGGGKYNNYGVLSVAMANTVNALFNIKKYVFEEKRYTLSELDFYRRNNFRGHEDVHLLLKNSSHIFGSDSKEAIELTNLIFERANKSVEIYRNRFGGKAKFGLSSPGYIQASENYPASFDGRKAGEPFAVHISADGDSAFTELMQFASKLNYDNARFNGNVVDFFVSPNFIQNNFEKFISFLKTSLDIGVFQTQLNVVSSQTLIAAREHPENFPNLIVRVWGFSAYYIELPDSYKDYLIERALESERAG